MSLPEDFVFSQSSLQDFVDCARRFDLRYLQNIRYPSVEAQPVLEHEEHMRQGAQFHRMVHQHLVGVPDDVLTESLAENETLSAWWDSYLKAGLDDLPANRYPEIALETDIGDYRLLAKYDLLAVGDGRAVIIDWKTSKATAKTWLEKRMQTLVYRYVLAQAGTHLNGGEPIAPENVIMIYWFIAQGRRVMLDYSAEQMKADEFYLKTIIGDIAHMNTFPLTLDEKQCRFCSYRSLCNRGEQAGSWLDFLLEDSVSPPDDDLDVDFDQIAEIEF